MRSQKARGRPRSQDARSAILQAAYNLLVDSGFGSFSIDAVASRAGVARTTIHRWWASKGILAIESFLEHILAGIVFRTTDCASRDLLRLLEDTAKILAGADGRVIASIIAESQRDPDALKLFMDVYFHPVRSEAVKVVQAGIDRGEFRPDLDPAVLLDAGIGAMYARLLLQQPITGEWTKRMVEQLLQGALAARSRGARSASPGKDGAPRRRARATGTRSSPDPGRR